MTTITTRSGKGSPLTNNEVDANFTNLNDDKVEASGDSMTGDLSFGDNNKVILGASNDLQIYHDGSNSYIQEAGSGNLYIQGSNAIRLRSSASLENMLEALENGAVTLYHNNSAKLATTSTGIDVTGTTVTDGVQSTDGDIKVTTSGSFVGFNSQRAGVPSSGGFQLGRLNFDAYSTGTTFVSGASIQSFSDGAAWTSSSTPAYLSFQTTPSGSTSLKERIKIANNGDISFYEDTGTTAKLTWSAADESLAIGATSPTAKLDVRDSISIDTNGNTGFLRFNAYGTEVGRIRTPYNSATTSYDTLAINVETGNRVVFTENNNSKVIFSSGQVGIGTDSPDAPFTIQRPSNNQGIAAGLSLKGQDGTTQGGLGTDGVNDNAVQLVAAQFIKFHTSNTDGTANERMRIDASGNLLVGTTDTTLYNNTTGGGFSVSSNGFTQIAKQGVDSADPVLILNQTGLDGEIQRFYKDGVAVGSIGTQSGNPYIGGTNRGIRFDSAQIIPADMTASGSNSDNSIDIGDSGVRFKDLYLSGSVSSGGTYRAGNTGTGNIIIEGGQHIFRFGSGGSYAERARIDTSGNLLVGKTTSSFNTAGIEARSGGTLWATADGTNAASFNRKTSDGDIALFSKDGSTVGSIGTANGNAFILSNDVGLTFAGGNDAIFPTTSAGAYRDAAIDLGGSGQRFKTLYLSNSVKNTSGALSVESGGGGQLLITASSELIFSSNAAERGRFNTSGNFLVGTTSSTLYSSSSETGTNITSQGGLYIAHNGTNLPVFNRITSDGDIADFRKNGAVVGSIGVSSGDLVIGTGVAGVRFKDSGPSLEPRAANGNGNDGGIDLGMSSSRWRNLYLSGGVRASTLKFENLAGTTEYARFDGSGNLLVGKTTTTFGTAGIALRGTVADFTRDGGVPINVNRLTDDGNLIAFHKSGVLVGSIGVEGGDLTIGTDTQTGLHFWNNAAIRPWNITANTRADAVCDLGESNTRFKNLYLSGGVYANNASGAFLWNAENSHIAFGTNNAERARFNSAGNLQVGHTNSDNSRVSVEAVSAGVAMHFRRNTATYTTSAIVGSITCDSSSTSYGTSSDQRLKDNIVDAPSASDDIDAIQVRSFDWKADGSHQKYGMVAQELQSVAPIAVTGDADSDDMMGVDYSKLVPMLVKEIQSLRARVAQLEGAN